MAQTIDFIDYGNETTPGRDGWKVGGRNMVWDRTNGRAQYVDARPHTEYDPMFAQKFLGNELTSASPESTVQQMGQAIAQQMRAPIANIQPVPRPKHNGLAGIGK